ncbi:MAG: AI-2E family transporter [Collinsella sp.]|nr:AI-2E family transporter [Collinsella sp.]
MQDRTTSRATHDRGLKTLFLNVWIAIGIIVILGVALQLLGILSGTLLFLAVGATASFVASPIVNVLDRRGMPRGLAAIIGLVVVIVGVMLLFMIVIPLFAGQVIDLLRDAPKQLAAFGAWIAEMETRYAIFEHLSGIVDFEAMISTLQQAFNEALAGIIGAVKDGLVPMVNNIASTVFIVFLGFVLAYWLALDYPRINDEICDVLGDERALDYRLMIAVVSRSVGGYLRSTVINSIIQGALAFVGFAIVGHPYAGAMGVLSGVLNIIPVVGPSISAFIAALIALAYSPSMAFWTMAVAILSQNVTDNLIAPKINQSTMQVHPVLSLTALILGSTLGGTVGMIVALPIAAVVKSLFIFYFESRTGNQIVSYDGALFKGTPFQDADGAPVPAFDALGDDTFVSESRILSDDVVPEAKMVPPPPLDNPWAKLQGIDGAPGRLGQTGVFRSPFSHTDDASQPQHGSDEGK